MKYKLSIITITYQAKDYINSTLQSVFEQKDLQAVEYIVVDGASTDGTWEIIQNHSDKIQQKISEKDKGIYDAMNKGLQMATGEYVLFLNAGDTFANAETLSKILKDLEGKPDVLYGEAQFINLNHEILGLRSDLTPQKLPTQATWKDFKFGMVICHQSFIAKKTIAPLFDLKYRLSSDVDWEINCLKRSNKIQKTDYPISNYLMGGASVQNLKDSWKERFEVLKSHFGLIPTIFHHLFIIFRGLIFAFQKKGKYW